jgi:hypothetical protein
MTDVMVDDVARALRAEGYVVSIGLALDEFLMGRLFARVGRCDDHGVFVGLYWDAPAPSVVIARSLFLSSTATLDQIVEVARTFRVQCGEVVR